ncbi:MAG: helix-turn-helix domain-containing protein [Chitinophagaceae bacterium]
MGEKSLFALAPVTINKHNFAHSRERSDYMSHFDASNTIFQKAVAFVNQTNSHLFVTGKAGTGKTTFLKYIRDNCFKKIAIVAPTGVAAINAGGVTIHSFFQLPFGTYLPTRQSIGDMFDGMVNNQHTLFKNLRLNAAKRELLQELDLLIIDEVSMVRADTLDAIDTVLKSVRQQPLTPFGGVQVLYIGDLFQLPPVVRQDEWKLLQEFYKSPFFFDALVLQQAQPVFIELKKIYRQTDEVFISILNNIRNNCCTPEDMQHLHQYYQPGFSPAAEENYITLTSHNEKADSINRMELHKLQYPPHTFRATITGDFNERSYPAEEELQLKKGAQIMFIKNDKGENRRYYNGKIGIIHSIDDDKVMISFPNEPYLLQLEQEKWQNIRYKYNKESDTLDEEELGTFSQYPIRLAWAITIHKSQGLTFTKAIIDAGASFAAGQVYVALSRLTGLEGLVLRSRIQPGSIFTDERVLQFVQSEMPEHLLQETLETEQQSFVKASLLKRFNWDKIVNNLQQHLEGIDSIKVLNKSSCFACAGAMMRAADSQQEVSAKFTRQLEQLLVANDADGYAKLHTRMQAAVQYFVKEIDEKLLSLLEAHIKDVSSWPKVKKYVAELNELKTLFERQKEQLLRAAEITQAMQASEEMARLLELTESLPKTNAEEPGAPLHEKLIVPKKPKAVKGDSSKLSLQLFKEGKSVAEIAAERELAPSTIESHLVSFIPTGEVQVLDLVPQEKFDRIAAILEAQPDLHSSAIRMALNDEVSFGEIRAVVLHYGKLMAAND